MNKEHKLIQSYYLEKYFISTAYRRASTLQEIWYYETIVWEWDKKTRERGKILEEMDSGTDLDGAIADHCEICRNLAKGE